MAGLAALVAATVTSAGTILSDTITISTKDRIVASGKMDHFDRSTLFDYSDGGADMYLDAGMVECLVRQYAFRGSTKGSVEIAAYDMKTPLRATGLFQTIAEDLSVTTNNNVQTVSDVRRTVFHKDLWVMDIIDKSDPAAPPETLVKTALALASQLPGNPGRPSEFALLPQQNKTVGSERYYYRNFLSRSYLPCALAARYTVDAVPCTLFVSDADSVPASRRSMGKLAESFSTVPIADTLFTPTLVAVLKGVHVVGVVGGIGKTSALALIKGCLALLK
jgi:hypothetical protein